MESNFKIQKGRASKSGFLKAAVIIIVALILLKYTYDIDVLDRIHDFGLKIWGEYGHYLTDVWEWLKAKW